MIPFDTPVFAFSFIGHSGRLPIIHIFSEIFLNELLYFVYNVQPRLTVLKKGKYIMDAWLENLSKHVKMKDKRLKTRLIKLLESMSQWPESSIPEACCSHSATIAAYRFFDNDRVEADDIRASFFASTFEKVNQEKIVLFPTDVTGLNFSSRKKLDGIGPLRNHRARGLVCHSALALTEKSVPLGLVYQKVWGRSTEKTGVKEREKRKELSFEQKETYKWVEAVKVIGEKTKKGTLAIVIKDRGGDIFDLFSFKRADNVELLVRAKVNRSLLDKNLKLFDFLSGSKLRGISFVDVKRSRKNSARKAKLELRFELVSIAPPKNRSKENLQPVSLYAIEAKEVEMNNDVKDPILWRLVTTIPTNTLKKAKTMIKWYSLRWMIERYHYVLKSGCKVEELQLESVDRIEKAFATYCIVAWRLLFLTYKARSNPDEPCDSFFTTDQWQACYIFLHKKKPPLKPPSMVAFTLIIAKLGGFLARKSDGNPGVKVLWRGIRKVDVIAESFATFKGIFVYNE